jgi:hypothetical protein
LIQSTPSHSTSWKGILILFSHLRLGLPSGLFPSGFPTKNLYALLLSLIRTTCPPNSFFSILSPEQIVVNTRNNKCVFQKNQEKELPCFVKFICI